MVGFIFTICILTILAAVGVLFAWMVRLASVPEDLGQQNSNLAVSRSDLPKEDLYLKK